MTYEDFTSAKCSPRAKIQGVVTSLSPMKKSKSNCDYFDGELHDGKIGIRVFGFDTNVRRKLFEHFEKDEPVVIANCEMKQSRTGKQLEVAVGKFTDVTKSSRSFDVKKTELAETYLDELEQCPEQSVLAVCIKVVRVDDLETVAGGLQKQDVFIGDATRTARVTLWERDIGKLELDKSYKLIGIIVKVFKHEKYLNFSTNSIVQEVGDIGPVKELVLEEQVKLGAMVGLDSVRIVAVEKVDCTDGCWKCGGTVVVDEEDVTLGECNKCNVMQCREECKKNVYARFTVKSKDGTKVTLSVYSYELLQEIVGSSVLDITRRSLFRAQSFNIKFKDGIIRCIDH